MRRGLIALLIAILVVGSTGCGLLDSDPFRDKQEQLDRAMARWVATGPGSYRMVYQRGCFCGTEITQPVEIRVVDGQVEDRRHAEDGTPVPSHLAQDFLPVHRIFEEVQEAIDRRAVRIDVHYHPELGYPVEVYFDLRHEIADEEVSHRVLELVPLD